MKTMPLEKISLIPEGSHTCKECKEVKDNSKFYWMRYGENTNNIRRQGNTCNKCKTYNYREVKKLKKLIPVPKDSKCQCCGKKTRIFLDHDHFDNKFRGWLCQDCNLGIGRLGDSEEGLKMALKYLKGISKRQSEIKKLFKKN